jgi:predicted metal-binding membrane protein
MAGAVQFTKWKAHHLGCWRQAPGSDCVLSARAGAAWKLGLRFGVHCGLSCANFTAILLAIGLMDLRAMAAVTAAITAERLAPGGERVARIAGIAVVGAALFLIVRAARLA